MLQKVLVLGGTGHFGRLLIEDLSRLTQCELVVPSRHAVDLRNPASLEAALSGATIAICAAGPFQGLPTTLADLCLQRGVHYIDLADDRTFVRKVHSVVSMHGENLPAICSGWSTVSALSGLLSQIGAAGLDEVYAIYIHMAPGNRLPRGAGTIASLLHSVGKPFTVFRDGRWQTTQGWSEPRSYPFPPPIGVRRGYLVDVPDHELFPAMFHARTVEFRTASELGILNLAVSFLGPNWAAWSTTLRRATAVLGSLGHDWGGVGVEVIGSNGHRRVSVIADPGGQCIPVMPASIMTEELLSGSKHRGLVSPADWLTAERLREECEKRAFRLIVEEL